MWVTSAVLGILGFLLEFFGLSLLSCRLTAMPEEDKDCKSDHGQHEDCAPGTVIDQGCDRKEREVRMTLVYWVVMVNLSTR